MLLLKVLEETRAKTTIALTSIPFANMRIKILVTLKGRKIQQARKRFQKITAVKLT